MATTTHPATLHLKDGDRLTRIEFERLYDAKPPVKLAELIEGVVSLPGSTWGLANRRFDLIGWTGPFCAATPGVDGGVHPSIRLDLDNMPQPTLVLRIRSDLGGQTRLDGEGCLEGPPELVADVVPGSIGDRPDSLLLEKNPDDRGGPDNLLSGSRSDGRRSGSFTEPLAAAPPGQQVVRATQPGQGEARISPSDELRKKCDMYRRNGVREYIIWRVRDDVIDWFVLRGGQYERLASDEQGRYRSEVLPGLWLDPSALIRGDLTAMFQFVNEGVATPEHAAFVDRLRQAAGGHPNPR